MSYRFMRAMVMFDLPVETPMDRRHYRWFKKYLIDEGFIMMQESIYTKICANMHTVERIRNNLEKNKPPKGIVQLMVVTERQYAGMDYIVGESQSLYIQSDERMIII